MSNFFQNLKKFTKNPWKGYRYLRNSLIGDSYRKNIKYIKEQNIVWNPCTPKSASTFWGQFCLSVLEKKNIKTNFFDPVEPLRPYYDDRYQVWDSRFIRSSIAPFQDLCICSHAHTLATKDVLGMFSDKHLIVCQTRPILDTIVSLVDQLDLYAESSPKEFPFFWNPFLKTYWSSLSFQEKIDQLVRVYLPWHINFLQTWIYASNYFNFRWIYFDDVTGNTQKCFNEIYSRWHVQLKNEDVPIIKPSRFNKGISGRGKSKIPEKTIEYIVGEVKNADKLNQSLEKYI